ncbi:MAG: 3-isopropylmalate dehydratase [Candidatus Delongbacteria bacterium]|nr:3-isopropylmalate dehydratase [Candidatus Delongbacteria bacterium]
MVFETGTAETSEKTAASEKETSSDKPTLVEGRTWFIQEDNIDTDMIFHNRYLSITDIDEMGQYALDNLEGYEDFAEKAKPEDIIVTQKNFGSGSSRQQAVDCFKVLGINAILAESFGAIYERNAINAAMPVMQYKSLDGLKLENGDHLRIDFKTGVVENLDKNTKIQAKPFSDVQMDIYQRGGIFK